LLVINNKRKWSSAG